MAKRGQGSNYHSGGGRSGSGRTGYGSYGRDYGRGGRDNRDGGGYGGRDNRDGGGYGGRDNRDGGGYGGRDNRDGGYSRDSYGRGGRYADHGGYSQNAGPGGNFGRYRQRPSNTGPLAPKRGKSFEQPIPDGADPGDPATFYSFSGVLEMHPNGYGFLRDPKENYDRQLTDPFVPGSVIDKLNLREGLLIHGMVQPGKRNQGPRLVEIIDIDGMQPEEYFNVKTFDEMTPINPESWLRLETGPEPLSTRVMDLLTPLGKGQRALIVAPPRSGKTVLLQHISQAITTNYPDVHVIVLLVDERPEEVTDFRRAVKAEVVASSLDCELENHVRLSQFVIERCKRLSEMGKDVFLLLDSITRLARAFNKWVGNTGRTMTGGIDVKAMDIPKKIFSSARAHEEGGSLTIVGTALIDTGSRMDELIFQEFKGTGNMELVLDRRLADRRVWPAIDVSKSGTRREEKLLPPENLRAVNMLRRALTPMNPIEAMEQLTNNLARCDSNAEFFNKFTKYG